MPLIWKVLETVDYLTFKLTGKLPKSTLLAKDGTNSDTELDSRAKIGALARPKLGKAERPAQIFGKQSCLWSGRAKLLLQDRGIAFDYVDLDEKGHEAVALDLVRETQQNEVPYVFLRGEFIGGFNALSELDRLGQLESRVLSPAERSESPLKAKIVVAERPPEGRPPGELG